MNYSIEELIKCAGREVGMRKNVYPGRVDAQRMSQADAEKEIGMMEEIYLYLKSGKATDQVDLWNAVQKPGEVSVYLLTLQPDVERRLLTEGKIKERFEVIIYYLNGWLECIQNLTTQSPSAASRMLSLSIPNNEALIISDTETWKWMKIEVLPVNQKIAVFCEAYKQKFGDRYKVNSRDGRRWKEKDYRHIPANLDELSFYMSCAEFPLDGPKSIQDYLNTYNQLKQLMKESRKPKWPDVWDLKLYKKLGNDPASMAEYTRHLVSLGYQKVQTANGTVYKKEEI